MNGNGSPAAEAIRCPVCQARFRGAAICSRCGADLTPLMLLAAHAYSHRQCARRALRAGATDHALAEARAAQRLHTTPQGGILEMVCATAAHAAQQAVARSPLAIKVLNSAGDEIKRASPSILAHQEDLLWLVNRHRRSQIRSPLRWKTLALSATAVLVVVGGYVRWSRQRKRP